MRARKQKLITSFSALNIVQFLTALNDNIFKLLLVFLLINVKGVEKSNAILATAGFIFVIPFLLFASTSGTLADRLSKKKIIVFTRFTEIVIVALGVLAFAFQSALGCYAILFLMATQSAIFSPCKYGILPEIVKKEKISHYNGVLTATTYLAIIVGTFLASFLADVTHKNFVLSALSCLIIASLGAFFSLGIEKTKAQAREKKVSARFITQIYRTVKKARNVRYLVIAIVFAAYFLFMGAYVQLNIIPFAIQSLGRSEIQGGYLFLMTAIGIGIGSFLSGKIAQKEVELGLVPFAAFGIAIVFLLLYLFAKNFYAVSIILVVLGILGGFYIVPLESFIQTASPNSDRGENVAAGNFLSFLGVIFASLLIATLGGSLELQAKVGFLTVSILTFVMALTLFLLMMDQVIRLLIATFAKYFWDLRVVGEKNLRVHPPCLLIAKRESWLDTVVMMAILPRTIRYVVPLTKKSFRGKRLFYHLLALKTFDTEHFALTKNQTLLQIKQELELGHSVCVMQPEQVGELEELLQLAVPLIPIEIIRKSDERERGKVAELATLFKYPIQVSFQKNLI